MQAVVGWRDRILKAFTPNVARLTVAADPDGLLLEEALLEAIQERGLRSYLIRRPGRFPIRLRIGLSVPLGRRHGH